MGGMVSGGVRGVGGGELCEARHCYIVELEKSVVVLRPSVYIVPLALDLRLEESNALSISLVSTNFRLE